MSIPFWAWGVAALVGGYILAKWLTGKLEQSERDRAEKVSLQNYVKGKVEADEAGEEISAQAKKVSGDKAGVNPLDW